MTTVEKITAPEKAMRNDNDYICDECKKDIAHFFLYDSKSQIRYCMHVYNEIKNKKIKL